MTELKTIVLCADDFGLNSGISEGILKLVHMGRLSAVSCMVNQPDFIRYAQELIALKKQVKIGLHFNLTEGYLVSNQEKRYFSLNELLIKTHLRLIDLPLIAKEVHAQLNQFMHVMKHPPDFIDGHQHVHQLPGIRKVILDLYEQKLRAYGTSIRSTWPFIAAPPYQFKAQILGFTGGKALRSQLVKSGIPHNSYFSGIYDFAQNTNYRDLFKQWLNSAQNNTLIMCHPSLDISYDDTIASARLIEFNYFSSDEFVRDCQTLNKVI